jgi:hypothetical protein
MLVGLVARQSNAQPWSGIIDPSRAVDWSAGNAGAASINNVRTQCGSTITAANGSAATINSAIAACGANQYVLLGPGTFNLSSGITFGSKSNVTLRGSGANQTFLIFTGNTNCLGFGAAICISASSNPVMPSPNNTTTWTAGYAKGTTVITVGSSSGMAVGNILILDQLDDATDTGGIYVCATTVCTGQGGNVYGRSGRAQQQIVKVAAINGNQVTISPGLYMPNWRSSQSPGASWSNSNTTGDGVENLSLDLTNSGVYGGIIFLYTQNSWVKGVRTLNSNRDHVLMYQSRGNTVRDSYFYGTQNAASQSYGVEGFSSSDLLVENNIFQHIVGGITLDGSDSGSVFAYNFSYDSYYAPGGSPSNWMIPSFIQHEAGQAMDLFEGNDGLAFEGDNIHGTHHFMTAFRNNLYGDTCNCPAKSNNTDIIKLWAFTRYYNIIGNVLGRTGYYNTYETNLGSTPTDIFSLGAADGENSSPLDDPLVKTTIFRWGNYDTVSAATRFVTAEVPSGLSLYANPIPTTQALPTSLYLQAKPAWWGTVPWPAIGPDVSGGSGAGGHAYVIPARACYNNSPVDTNYGSNIRLFDPSTCYAQAAVSGPNPPTGLSVVVH